MNLRPRQIQNGESKKEKSNVRRSNSVPKSFKFVMENGATLPDVRIVLDRSFVANYLRKKEEKTMDLSAISISSDDSNESVQFVSEEGVKQIREREVMPQLKVKASLM